MRATLSFPLLYFAEPPSRMPRRCVSPRCYRRHHVRFLCLLQRRIPSRLFATLPGIHPELHRVSVRLFEPIVQFVLRCLWKLSGPVFLLQAMTTPCQASVWRGGAVRSVSRYGVGSAGGAPDYAAIGYKSFCAIAGSSNPNGGVSPIGPADSQGRLYWIGSVNAGYVEVDCID